MIKNLHYYLFVIVFIIESIDLQAQTTWELQLNTNHQASFATAYKSYPNLPKGILEAVAYTMTHIRHVQPQQEQPSCVGMPSYYGVMGLVQDGHSYFRNNLTTVAQLSGYSIEQIQHDAHINIMAYAKAYNQLMEDARTSTTDLEEHIGILDLLSELPNDGQLQNNFAFDSHLYSIFKTLNEPKFQATYQLPNYQIDLQKMFGERYAVLSAGSLVLDGEGVRTSVGTVYNNNGLRTVLAPPCTDVSGGFPYTVLQNAADPSNYSSRLGVAITHITIHTMQGTYAGAISWFKNPAANVSAHYNLRASDGQITQMVCEIDKAWHVGNSNPYAVGIEHEGYIDDPSWYTNVMYVVSAALSKDIATRNGISTIRTYDKNGDSGIKPISDGCFKIKGHQHFPAQTHVDPGPYWDWNRYYDLINTVAGATTNTYTTCAGTFYDSGGSGANYGNDERIFYQIAPTGATSVTLTFTSLNLELNYDYLYIYNGDSHNDPLLAVLNGTTLPAPIVATSGKMLLEFRTDCATVASGWAANWTCSSAAVSCSTPTGLTTSNHNQNGVTLNWNSVVGAANYEVKVKQTIGTLGFSTYYTNSNSFNLTGLASNAQYIWLVRAICGVGDTSVAESSEFINVQPVSSVTTTNCTGIFTDSGGELGKYRKNENYTYTISPTGATSVTMTFSVFDVELNYDFLYIYDGPSTASPLLGTYTGTTLPPITTSTGGSLTIRFTSDVATQNAGWKATWTCVDNPVLPTYPNPILLNNTMKGNLDCGIAYHDFYDSGNSGGMYSNNENNVQTYCNTDPNKAVRLSFRPNPTAAQQLAISSVVGGNDYLYFYNGVDTLANLIGVYTGASSAAPQPGTFISSGACLTVKMSSDNAFVGNGWIARLYCSNPPTNLGTINVGGVQGTKVFRDLGGVGNYTNNENYIITYCPDATAPAGEAVWAQFVNPVGLESNWDYLYVFDGNNTQARLIGIYTGDAANQNRLETIKASVQNSSGCLTFQFFSDGATTFSGWEANMFTAQPRLAFGAENCENVTQIKQTGRDYAGSTTIATGTPGVIDPSLNISLASLPGCSGANSITRLENTVWYQFTTPTATCVPTTMNIVINNISCQSEAAGGSGVQFVLYEVDDCYLGASWPQPIYCADKLTSGSSVDVASLLQPSRSYYLMIDGFTSQHCNFDIRFDVTTAGNPADCLLPLELVRFWGTPFNNSNQLQWETAKEDNVMGFYVQRASLNGIDFEDIGFVTSKPTNNQQGALYNFEDVGYWRNAVNYYRLRQIDHDGSQNYSSTISIDRRGNKEAANLKVYPNPAKNWVVFAMDSPNEEDYHLKIYDVTGKVVYEQKGVMPLGYWTEQLNTSNLAVGMYIYQVNIGVQAIYGKFEKN